MAYRFKSRHYVSNGIQVIRIDPISSAACGEELHIMRNAAPREYIYVPGVFYVDNHIAAFKQYCVDVGIPARIRFNFSLTPAQYGPEKGNYRGTFSSLILRNSIRQVYSPG